MVMSTGRHMNGIYFHTELYNYLAESNYLQAYIQYVISISLSIIWHEINSISETDSTMSLIELFYKDLLRSILQ